MLFSFACGDKSPHPTTASGPRGLCFELVRPQGTARSTLTGTVGQGRSRFEKARDGLRPLEATAHNATHARLRSDTQSAAPKRTTEGPGNQRRKPCTRLPRHERSRTWATGHRRARDHLQRACGHEPSIADQTRERRPGIGSVGAISLKTGTVMLDFQASMTAGPPSRPPEK